MKTCFLVFFFFFSSFFSYSFLIPAGCVLNIYEIVFTLCSLKIKSDKIDCEPFPIFLLRVKE